MFIKNTSVHARASGAMKLVILLILGALCCMGNAQSIADYPSLLGLLTSVTGFLTNSSNTRIGGRTLTDYITVLTQAANNTFKFYAKSGIYSQPIEKIVTIYCKNATTNFTPVTVDTFGTIQSASNVTFFAVHGWTDSINSYYIKPLADGK